MKGDVNYDRGSGYVEFHENAKTYLWHIPSKKVFRPGATVPIAINCHNLHQAREAVRRK